MQQSDKGKATPEKTAEEAAGAAAMQRAAAKPDGDSGNRTKAGRRRRRGRNRRSNGSGSHGGGKAENGARVESARDRPTDPAPASATDRPPPSATDESAEATGAHITDAPDVERAGEPDAQRPAEPNAHPGADIDDEPDAEPDEHAEGEGEPEADPDDEPGVDTDGVDDDAVAAGTPDGTGTAQVDATLPEAGPGSFAPAPHDSQRPDRITAAFVALEERQGTLRDDRERWFRMAILMSLVATVCLGFGVWAAVRSEYVPYIVAVDDLGNIQPVQAPKVIENWPDAAVRRELADLVRDWRSITSDPVVLRQRYRRLQ